jgi:CRP/FNR family cyclic AMP-dependent transcriptional regulator
MRVDTEFPVVNQLMMTSRSRPSPLALAVAHPVPSIVALVEAVLTLNAEDAFRPRFTAENWRIVAAYLVRQTLRSGDAIIQQDEPGRTAFLLESGTLLVHTRRSDGRAVPIALLRAGAVVGEPALFGEMIRMAEVIAISPCVVWTLGRLRLDELHAGHPKLAYELLRAAGTVMAKRMRATLAHTTPIHDN